MLTRTYEAGARRNYEKARRNYEKARRNYEKSATQLREKARRNIDRSGGRLGGVWGGSPMGAKRNARRASRCPLGSALAKLPPSARARALCDAGRGARTTQSPPRA
jgi:hypothetical protein